MLIKLPTENNHLAFLIGSGLKLIFHFCTLWLIFAKSLLSSAAALSILSITENNEVSANNLVLHDNSSASSFIYIKKVLVLVSNLR